VKRPCVLLALAALGCNGDEPPGTTPPTVDTDTGEPQILPLDSFALPEDTAPEVIPDLTPDHYVILTQVGLWNLGNASAPWGSVSGTLRVREFVDALDTAEPVYECNVEYTLTGTEVTPHDCPGCDFVMAVEHYVVSGDPSACHDPDVPLDGAVRHLGYENGAQKLLFDYYGSGVWLPWYDADRTGQVVDFEWTAQLGIELPDSAD
jgi:hypothetical protein